MEAIKMEAKIWSENKEIQSETYGAQLPSPKIHCSAASPCLKENQFLTRIEENV